MALLRGGAGDEGVRMIEQYGDLVKTRLAIQFEAPPNRNQHDVHAQGDCNRLDPPLFVDLDGTAF